MNKRGQFFIFAAIIIVSVVIGLMGISNYVNVNDEPRGFSDLTKELGQETNQVINYESISGDSGKLDNFTNQALENLIDADPDREIIVIFGNSSKLTVTNCAKEKVLIIVDGVPGSSLDGCLKSSTICTGSGSSQVCTSTTLFETEKPNAVKTYKTTLDTPASKKISLQFASGKTYEFDISAGQNFFSVLKKNLKEEEYVDTSK
jgi:hypothetical protein